MNHPTTEYPILSLTREDLETAGFDARTLDDAVMTRLAGKMADEFIDEFLSILGSLAEQIGVPKRISSNQPASAKEYAHTLNAAGENPSSPPGQNGRPHSGKART